MHSIYNPIVGSYTDNTFNRENPIMGGGCEKSVLTFTISPDVVKDLLSQRSKK